MKPDASFLAYLKNILFIDIETVSAYENLHELSPKMQELWETKATRFNKDSEKTTAQLYQEKANLYAEFGRIVSIGISAFFWEEENQRLCLKSTVLQEETNEGTLLEQFIQILQRHKAGNQLLLCAHNGKEFDYPYLCRRMLLLGLAIPPILRIHGKKPWEISLLDTMDLWKFGDYRYYTSLELLMTIFGIQSSKEEIAGKDIGRVYYQEKDTQKIARYCEKDAIALAQLYLRMNGYDPIPEEHINPTN